MYLPEHLNKANPERISAINVAREPLSPIGHTRPKAPDKLPEAMREVSEGGKTSAVSGSAR